MSDVANKDGAEADIADNAGAGEPGEPAVETVETFDAAAFADPQGECDLVMEGGITSGVVYPRALIQLARRFRFRAIGGTSAGAIAAAVAAAAEHGRANGAFVELQKLPRDLAKMLLDLFQPVPSMRGVFNAFLSTMRYSTVLGKVGGVVWNLVRSHWLAVLVGTLIPALLYPWPAKLMGIAWAQGLLGLLVVLVSFVIALAIAVILALLRHLPENGFGICPGRTQPHFKALALTEWLTGYLDLLAGPRPAGPATHLTFGDLKKQNVELKMMTSNLSMRRPYSLPMQPTRTGQKPEFAFVREEFLKLFPDSVVDQMAQRPVPNMQGYFYFPEPDDLPVVVAVRMSLSFPILLCTVPLYRQDHTYFAAPAENDKLRRCVFSDGGICSDFPIQFFDSLVPTRPTFAISLGKYDARRNGADRPQNRVFMPKKAGSGATLSIEAVESAGQFVGSIVTTARVWQDSMQSVLAGYRERIVHVSLDDREGGLNLNMPKERVDRLSQYGDIAGQRMLAFDFPEHRWRRFVASVGGLEKMLLGVHRAYQGSFETFLATYPGTTRTYKQSQTWLADARALIEALDKLMATQSGNLHESSTLPRPPSTIRVTPDP